MGLVKNTDLFYIRTKEYQQKRLELVKDYEEKIQSIKKYEGSQGYEEEMKKAQEDFEKGLEKLKSEYGSLIRMTLKDMRSAISKRKVNPPTNEQLNLIRLLKKLDNPSKEDLDRVSEMCKGNVICLEIIQEIAKQKNIRGVSYVGMSNEMSSGEAERALKKIEGMLPDWLDHYSSKGSRAVKEFYNRKYGNPLTPEHELPRRSTFADRAGCYKYFTGLEGESLNKFSDIVDAE